MARLRLSMALVTGVVRCPAGCRLAAGRGPGDDRACRPPPRIEEVLVEAIATAERSVVAIARVSRDDTDRIDR